MIALIDPVVGCRGSVGCAGNGVWLWLSLSLPLEGVLFWREARLLFGARVYERSDTPPLESRPLPVSERLCVCGGGIACG